MFDCVVFEAFFTLIPSVKLFKLAFEAEGLSSLAVFIASFGISSGDSWISKGVIFETVDLLDTSVILLLLPV